MKRFLNRVLGFIFPILLGVVGVSFFAKQSINSKPVFALPKNITTLILGHSQPECAFNDSLIPHVKNMAQGGEAYFYTYQKIKKIISANPHIKTVYLSFSNNQIESRMDNWTYDDEHMSTYFPKYAGQLDLDDYIVLLKHNYSSVLSGELRAMKNNISFLSKGKTNFLENNNWGGYLFLKESKLDSIIKVNYIRKIQKELSNKRSEINIIYLEKIVNICKVNKVNLIFFRTPIHPLLFSIYNEHKFQNLRKQRFATIPFLDFHEFKLKHNEMRDFNHLNYKGAKKFSVYFNTFIMKTRMQRAEPTNAVTR